jgi:colicin import membrane protein
MENLRRMASLAGASNDFQTVPYSQRITQRIKPNIVYVEEVEGNPSANVEIKCAEDGRIIGVRLIESSGSKGWDEAVLKAVVKTQSLPLDSTGKVPPILIVHFKPKE